MISETEFYKFLQTMSTLPTPQQLDEYCKNDCYIGLFEHLESIEYFKLLSPIQKYHLFLIIIDLIYQKD